MGYLSQKKHQLRENLLLNVASVILTFFTLFSLINTNFDIVFPNLFQLYIFSFILFVYSIIVKKYKVCLIFMMLFIINYTALSSSGNIFLSDSYKGNKKLELVFDKSSDIAGNFKNLKLNKGSLVLAGNITAPYVKIEDVNPMIIIKVDLNNVSTKTLKTVLNQLRHFITKQDCPVVLYGDFGVPSWNRYMRKFARQSRLSVKNKILHTNDSGFKFFSLPSFYILGFSNMGIDNIETSNLKNKIIKFDIVF